MLAPKCIAASIVEVTRNVSCMEQTWFYNLPGRSLRSRLQEHSGKKSKYGDSRNSRNREDMNKITNSSKLRLTNKDHPVKVINYRSRRRWAPAGTWNTIAVVHNESAFGKNLLIDCMRCQGMHYCDISSDSIELSGLRICTDDHIDILSILLFERYCFGKQKPTLFIHEDVGLHFEGTLNQN